MNSERRILIPLDHSPLAEAVVPKAAAVARALGYGLTLAEVVTLNLTTMALGWPAGVPMVLYDSLENELRKQASAYLTALAQRLTGLGLDVRTEVLIEDDIVAGIIERARRDPETALIAMSTHGRSGLKRLVFGSVAERVLHETPVPLLLVHGSDSEEARPHSWICDYATILVPLDGSAFAAQAIAPARALAVASGATLVLATALPRIDDPGLAEGGVEPYWTLADLRLAADRQLIYLDQMAEQLAGQGVTVRVSTASGDPCPAILQVAENEKADLIVMTTHGRSGMQRLWLGSVANQIVRSSTRPVLLIRADEDHGAATIAAASSAAAEAHK